MKPKKIFIYCCPLIFTMASYGQNYNPYKLIKKKAKVITAYGNKFAEVFDATDVQRMGSVLINIHTRKIVKMLNADSLAKKAADNSISGRWYSIDPLADDYYSYSPYNFVLNNPINMIDPDGTSVYTSTGDPFDKSNNGASKEFSPLDGTQYIQSTHTDKDGNVIGVYNDGDLGVYKHDGDKVTKMGETKYWDSFLASHPNEKGEREPKSSSGKNYKIDFGTSWDKLLDSKIKIAYDLVKNQGSAAAAAAVQNGGALSLQDQEANGKGRLFKGKYVSGEEIGNYFAGVLGNFTALPTYDGFQRLAGAYELKTHGHPEIGWGKWDKLKLVLGITSYGTHPLHGELIQQYRWSTVGWKDGFSSWLKVVETK